MKLVFHKIIIENFLSIGYAEINLQDRGFTLVNGVNNNPMDSALSNGSGKSTIFEAISWALTGETVRGIKDVVNMFTDGGTMVELHFTANKDEYVIQRYKEHKKFKTDMKITINGEDKSGKGIRDSQKLLESYLPDLTPSLLGSVIILGQGLPQRFTNNSPSGRKEVLEKLSKSDFMIEDLKNRLADRKSKLSDELRTKEDEILVHRTKISTLNNQIETARARLSSLEDPSIYENTIAIATRRVEELRSLVSEIKDKLYDEEFELKRLLNEKSNITASFKDISNTTDTEYFNSKSSIDVEVSKLDTRLSALRKEVRDAKNVKDTCPTCGRKFDGVYIPDTAKQEDEIVEVEKLLSAYRSDLSLLQDDYRKKKSSIDNDMRNALYETEALIREKQVRVQNYNNGINGYLSEISTEERNINKYEMLRSNYTTTVETINHTIRSNTEEVEKLNKEIVYNNEAKDTIDERLSAINKFILMTNRDFRGYLLKNVIKFIDSKAKEYCQDVFGTRELDFVLDGNNIDVKYCGKYMESLSGGEKQKIDLIIQFAIRDMLCQFLDFRSNIIALDEIFDALDSVSCDKVVDLISRKLSDIDSVFIITHHKELGIPADNTITVVKDSNGVSSVC